MEITTIGIPIAFIVLATLFLWYIIGAKGHWLFKSALIVVSLFTSLFLWKSTEDIAGWPTVHKLPEKFQIFWTIAKEPKFNKSDSGAIYIFAQDLMPNDEFKLHSAENEPRLYKLPYSKEAHKQVDEIQKALKAGKPFFAGSKYGKGDGQGKGDGKGNGKGKGDGKGKGEGKGSGSFSKEQVFMIYELPPPKFPEKTQ